MKSGIIFAICISALLSSGCLLDSSDSEIVLYTDQFEFGFQIAQLIDNECINDEISISSHNFSFEDNFYLIESLEHLDSLDVHYEFEWTPHLEKFFPLNGMLLLYYRYTDYEVEYIDHSIELNGTTVHMDFTIEEYNVDNPLPGIREFIIPIGIIPVEEY